MAVSVEKGRVKMEFPKPVTWFALPPALAVELAQLLVMHARKADPKMVVTLTL